MGAEEIVTRADTIGGFAEAAANYLPKMRGLRHSESTVKRTSEAAGERLGTLWDQGHTLNATADWHRDHDAHGHTVAYVSIDATGVGMQFGFGAFDRYHFGAARTGRTLGSRLVNGRPVR